MWREKVEWGTVGKWSEKVEERKWSDKKDEKGNELYSSKVKEKWREKIGKKIERGTRVESEEKVEWRDGENGKRKFTEKTEQMECESNVGKRREKVWWKLERENGVRI